MYDLLSSESISNLIELPVSNINGLFLLLNISGACRFNSRVSASSVSIYFHVCNIEPALKFSLPPTLSFVSQLTSSHDTLPVELIVPIVNSLLLASIFSVDVKPAHDIYH